MAGDLKDRTLDVIRMLNMALAAAEIPKDARRAEDAARYEGLVSFIRNQYRMLTGTELPATQNILDAVRRIELPAAFPMPVEALRDYYERCIETLRKYA
jgi:hypothetical protein